MPRPLRIEICGGIASGKTSFARLFVKSQIAPIFEEFRANPFWKAFYSARSKYAFETEITFALQHYHEIKRRREGKALICDFSIFLDLAYTSVTLNGFQRQVFKSVHRQIRRDLGLPLILIYLDCRAKTQLERIRARGRAEENSIRLQYVQELNDSVRIEV